MEVQPVTVVCVHRACAFGSGVCVVFGFVCPVRVCGAPVCCEAVIPCVSCAAVLLCEGCDVCGCLSACLCTACVNGWFWRGVVLLC